MASVVNGPHTAVIDNNSEEFEFDFKEYYSREKTLELRDIYIP